ncbi:MAG: hypothetical protein HKN03_18410 [Acidimicrobiales bacterium]|nr:hypothetical protein [Acidimicrobiales bacterium]
MTGPLGDPVLAGWRMDDQGTGHPVAFIEMAQASGLALVGGAEGNDALAANTYGTGELIALAHAEGAEEITVFVGGSATTDGGLGAQRAMPLPPRLRSTSITVGVDVETYFTDAAREFGPQKGASPAQVQLLTRRLERLAGIYLEQYGVDVRDIPGTGAAGGLAGGLVAVGATLASGFDVLAEAAHLDKALDGVNLVVTGEGFCDANSFAGKVVGGVARWAQNADVPVLAVVGDTDLEPNEIPQHVRLVDLASRFGLDQALTDTEDLVATLVCATI